MRVTARLLTVALSMMVAAPPLAAQLVLGSVVTADGATPVAGGIVTASAPGGAPMGRALTNARGEFALRLSAPGTAMLTVLRIGFRPAAGPTVTLATGATERVRIVVSSAAVSLAGLGVREKETCRVRADTGLAVARVWEEARKAMLTSQLTEGAPLFAEWIEYERTLDSLSRTVRRQRIRTTRSPTTHAFRSVPADVLRERGFVVEEAGNSVFYAPDAEALLSDEFVSGHCFRLVAAPRDSASLLGIAFSPSRDRRNMREIEGTLWLDRESAELRTLDFRYVNLPPEADPARPGGLVEFHRLADGNWLISRWSVRMPQLAMTSRIERGIDRGSTVRRVLALRAVQVMGGEVVRALRGDSAVYRAVGPAVAVQVLGGDATTPAAGAVVTLDGTDYSGRADSLGLVRIVPVLAGRYSARVRTPLMETLGMPPVEREVEARMNARVDTIALPAANQMLLAVCPRDSIQDGEGMLHGRVLANDGGTITGATVTVTWADGFSVIGTANSDRLTYNERTLAARTDAAGRFRVCGVPRDKPLVATVASGPLFDRRQVRLNDAPFAGVDLVLHERVAESREIAALNPPRSTALVEIVVTNERGETVAGTTLEVYPASGPVRTVNTGPKGAALVLDVAFGPLSVRARKVGLTPGSVRATVDSSRVTLAIVMGAVRAPMLDTVRVIGARTLSSRLDEFERRRAQHQATASIGREDIEKRNPVDAWQLLTGLSSLNVGVRDFKVVAVSRRQLVDGLSDKPCFTRVMLDGVLLPDTDGFDLRQLPPVSEIHGIEYFDGPAAVPAQYSSTSRGMRCGLIAIWTR